jgi:hypothetical protein
VSAPVSHIKGKGVRVSAFEEKAETMVTGLCKNQVNSGSVYELREGMEAQPDVYTPDKE